MIEEQKTEAPEAEHVEPEFLPPVTPDAERTEGAPPPSSPPEGTETPPDPTEGGQGVSSADLQFVPVGEVVDLGAADLVTAECLLAEAVPGLTRIGDYHLVNKIQEFLARA